VRFESLYAEDFCGIMTAQNNITTVAFDPGELSTTVGYRWDTSMFSIPPSMVSFEEQNFTEATWDDQ
jgi:hypothetical protein